ncbi:MAG TPA: PDZ domain-containing protein [Clostridiaceae bacterium]|nr:PDZ domain-containing protein [Clostridiaceae bacterium]
MLKESILGYLGLFSSYEILIPLIGFILIYFRNRGLSRMKKLVLGEGEDHPLVLTFSQMVVGILAGLAVSSIMGYLQITFDRYLEIQVIMLMSILLVFIPSNIVNIGILPVMVLLMDYLSTGSFMPLSDVVNLYILLGIILIVSGVVFALDSSRGAVPIIIRVKERLLGGFMYSRTYIVPLAIGFYLQNESLSGMGYLILGTSVAFSVSQSFFTMRKKEASLLLGAIRSLSGGLVLLLTSLHYLHEELVFAVFALAPIILHFEKQVFKMVEDRRPPLFSSTSKEKVILEVSRNTPAYEKGVRSGDRIVSINNIPQPDFFTIVKGIGKSDYKKSVKLMILTKDNTLMEISLKMEPGQNIGFIVVPDALDKIPVKTMKS